MANQIQVIKPYWYLGTWVIDDPTTDLVQEPFVSGVPEMIDDLVAESGMRQLAGTLRFELPERTESQCTGGLTVVTSEGIELLRIA